MPGTADIAERTAAAREPVAGEGCGVGSNSSGLIDGEGEGVAVGLGDGVCVGSPSSIEGSAASCACTVTKQSAPQKI